MPPFRLECADIAPRRGPFCKHDIAHRRPDVETGRFNVEPRPLNVEVRLLDVEVLLSNVGTGLFDVEK
ncbi:MAG TPA: hypothetical protein VD997_13365 [Phycisphaerales bacterium]|nr:hypothetical protein [Phycisphaerales bacterium]